MNASAPPCLGCSTEIRSLPLGGFGRQSGTRIPHAVIFSGSAPRQFRTARGGVTGFPASYSVAKARIFPR